MASILLLRVFLLPMIGVLLRGLRVGLPGRLTLSGRRGIGGVLAGSVRTGVIGGSLWVFFRVGILGILWGSTTLLLAGDAVSVASKFLIALFLLAIFLIFPTRFVDEPFHDTESYQFR